MTNHTCGSLLSLNQESFGNPWINELRGANGSPPTQHLLAEWLTVHFKMCFQWFCFWTVMPTCNSEQLSLHGSFERPHNTPLRVVFLLNLKTNRSVTQHCWWWTARSAHVPAQSCSTMKRTADQWRLRDGSTVNHSSFVYWVQLDFRNSVTDAHVAAFSLKVGRMAHYFVSSC